MKRPAPFGDLSRHPDAPVAGGKPVKDLQAQIRALPFVADRKKGGRCFWAVKPSGNYQEDYNQGRRFALLVLPFLQFNVGARRC
jgi:hypothetical protein